MEKEQKPKGAFHFILRNLWWIIPLVLAAIALLFIFTDVDGLLPFKYDFF